LAVGRGSVIDGTKFIAAALPYDGDAWNILPLRKRLVFDAVPSGCVLMLPVTGSECNESAVISHPEIGDRQDFHSLNVNPRFPVLDPNTLFAAAAPSLERRRRRLHPYNRTVLDIPVLCQGAGPIRRRTAADVDRGRSARAH